MECLFREHYKTVNADRTQDRSVILTIDKAIDYAQHKARVPLRRFSPRAI